MSAKAARTAVVVKIRTQDVFMTRTLSDWRPVYQRWRRGHRGLRDRGVHRLACEMRERNMWSELR